MYDDKHNENEKQKYIQQNQKRLLWLIKPFTTNVIKQAINKDFKGKIVINGDLYSYRLILFLMNKKEYNGWSEGERIISCEDVKNIVKNVNKSCYDLLNTLNNELNSNKDKQNLFIVAGNHDLYIADIIAPDYEWIDCLEELKNQTHILSSTKKEVQCFGSPTTRKSFNRQKSSKSRDKHSNQK